KTGKKTQNNMKVPNMWSGGELCKVREQGDEPDSSFMKREKEVNPAKTKSLYQLLKFGSLCNNANIIQNKKAHVVDGDPT
ncbi:hypothetical protein, partial [Bacillus cereus]|uniref:hypothetical protein n=1 Tax=Bacillus cereus TaxID=1396 RepID=UPI0028442552